METTGLHHFNITAPAELLGPVRDFYVDVLGLTVGERPDFTREGFWLYSRGEPIVHLTACADGDARADGKNGPNFFDHIAFACEGLAGLVSRLKQLNVAYEVVEIASLGQTQVFVRDPAGVGVELNFVNESMGYEFEYAVECPVGRDFAWRFWTDVGNWAAVDSSVEWVKLDGPFAGGTKGTTKPRGLAETEWLLAGVQDGKSAVIEVAAPGAVMRFSWTFEEPAAGVTRIAQRVSLEGEGAGGYAGVMKEFEAGIPAGMSSLARAIVRAANDAA